jgi:hypothetical protein
LVLSWLLGPALAQPPDNTLNQRAASVVNNYWEIWSSDNASALGYVDQVYAGHVLFYGEAISHQALLKKKWDFAQQWPARRYSTEPDKLSISCKPAAATYDVSGVVHWDAKSPERGVESSGDADFAFTLALRADKGLIQADSGSGIGRAQRASRSRT